MFKVGDRVRAVRFDGGQEADHYNGMLATVVREDNLLLITVRWDGRGLWNKEEGWFIDRFDPAETTPREISIRAYINSELRDA